PSHYYIWFEPPGDSGDEVLHFVSRRRRIKLKGQFFREFQQLVIPLLDGRHTVEEIEQKVAGVFEPRDLETALRLLADENLIDEGDSPWPRPEAAGRLAPHLIFFHEMGAVRSEIQERLSTAVVTVYGLGGAGALTAVALASAGVGTVRCVDSLNVAL